MDQKELMELIKVKERNVSQLNQSIQTLRTEIEKQKTETRLKNLMEEHEMRLEEINDRIREQERIFMENGGNFLEMANAENFSDYEESD